MIPPATRKRTWRRAQRYEARRERRFARDMQADWEAEMIARYGAVAARAIAAKQSNNGPTRHSEADRTDSARSVVTFDKLVDSNCSRNRHGWGIAGMDGHGQRHGDFDITPILRI